VTADPFAEHDAAYVLGALSPEDRRAYEAHLAGCAECTRAVRELAGMPGLLARVRLTALEEPAPQPPATLLPALAGAVHRRRLRRRWAVGAGAVAAAGMAVALGGGLLTASAPAPAPPAPTGITLSRVGTTPLHASARLVGVAWGTRIDLTCTYDPAYGEDPAGSYALVVVDRAGRTQQVATWSAVPGRVSRVTAATALRRSDIARVEVRTATGTRVLQLPE
jgi:hypothetical protein